MFLFHENILSEWFLSLFFSFFFSLFFFFFSFCRGLKIYFFGLYFVTISLNISFGKTIFGAVSGGTPGTPLWPLFFFLFLFFFLAHSCEPWWDAWERGPLQTLEL